jgi:hypothetical protein
MAYRNFKFSDLKEQFGVSQTTTQLFGIALPIVMPSAFLLEAMNRSLQIPLVTEKVISESIIFPILQEIKINNKLFIELFSGENLEGNKEKGLNGECDFIFAKSPGSKQLMAPIIQVIEAKQGEIDKPRPLAQVSAQLIGTQFFNQKYQQDIGTIYGVCTSGSEWLFLKLENNLITVDTKPYYLNQLPELLGVLQYIINQYLTPTSI